MARQTAAERKANEKIKAEQQEIATAAFQLTLPTRILELMAKADAQGNVTTHVRNSLEAGLSVQFRFPSQKGNDYEREETLTLKSEEWDVDSVVSEFNRLDQEHEELQRVFQVKLGAFEKLSVEERAALGLTRPFP